MSRLGNRFDNIAIQMQSKDIFKRYSDFDLNHFSLSELCTRVSNQKRASWIDIPKRSGVYIVHFEGMNALSFSKSTGQAKHSDPVPVKELETKWNKLIACGPTDIVYIGKGDSLRIRIRQLIRFGLGKAHNHGGGRRMWQIKQIDHAKLSSITCDNPRSVEKCLLLQFKEFHGNYPLANEQS